MIHHKKYWEMMFVLRYVIYGRRKDVSGFPFLSMKLSSKTRPSHVKFDDTSITMKYGEMAFVLRFM